MVAAVSCGGWSQPLRGDDGLEGGDGGGCWADQMEMKQWR